MRRCRRASPVSPPRSATQRTINSRLEGSCMGGRRHLARRRRCWTLLPNGGQSRVDRPTNRVTCISRGLGRLSRVHRDAMEQTDRTNERTDDELVCLRALAGSRSWLMTVYHILTNGEKSNQTYQYTCTPTRTHTHSQAHSQVILLSHPGFARRRQCPDDIEERSTQYLPERPRQMPEGVLKRRRMQTDRPEAE